MNKRTAIWLVTHYSLFLKGVYFLTDYSPGFVRMAIFRLLFRNLGRRCMIDRDTFFRYPSRISIGDDVSINRGCSFYGSLHAQGCEIVIGNHVAVGPHVTFFAASHDHHSLDLPDIGRSITVRDHAWIGGRSTILLGVTIGEGAVVAAGSVVIRDVAPYTIVGGNPAHFLKNRTIDPALRGSSIDSNSGAGHSESGNDLVPPMPESN